MLRFMPTFLAKPWRIRVGDHRVIYAINDDKKVIDIVTVRHRSAAYE